MSEWISVKDRLPDKEGTYLVFPRKDDYTAYFNKSGRYSGKWTNSDEDGYEHEVTVNHWMPLPPPPNR